MKESVSAVEKQIREKYLGARILLVEDEPINLEVTKDLLVEVGLVVDLAKDGVEAIQRAGQNLYAAVLMDVVMPNMNGLEATRHIRKLYEYDEIPIIALTANAFVEDQKQCIAAGMDDYLVKPVQCNDLYAVLAKWLARPKKSQG